MTLSLSLVAAFQSSPPAALLQHSSSSSSISSKQQQQQQQLYSSAPAATLLREDVGIRAVEYVMEPASKQRNKIGKFLQAEETAARVVQTTRRKTTIVSSNTKSRSSTMPGYSIPSKNQQSLSRGLKRLEDQTGQDLSALRTTAVQRKRSSVSGDAMYQASSSVPDSLVQFARELHQVERITPKQELQLGALIQDAIQLQSLYDTLETKLQREPTDAEWCVSSGMTNMEAIRQVIEDGLEAKNTLVTSNLRLVQGVVNVYIRNGLGGQYNAGDMMQEGVMVSQSQDCVVMVVLL